MTATECEDTLARTHLGRLGCSRQGQPYIVPILFSFDRERRCVYSFATVGQKVRWMRENPLVCLEVDDVADTNHWKTVVVFGRYEEIHDSPAEADARQRAEALFSERREWWLPGAARVGTREHPDVVVYRIQIDRMTGRRAARARAPVS